MAYEKFTTLCSTCVPLPIENIDTDQIIPARFLKATKREKFGENLFYDWRFESNHIPKKDFILNNKNYKGKILVTGKNFGSGSSREHAVWAIYDYGFRCVISSFFADIFQNNCLNIGVLPIQISEKFIEKIFKIITINPKSKIKINLFKQKIIILETNEIDFFKINSYKKNNMINGFDDIDFLQSIKHDIKKFEKQRLF